jgi:uroporphyrinogen-III synthase
MKTVWITRKSQPEEQLLAENLGLQLVDVPAIEIELLPFEVISVPHSPAWVFTSQHAVEWVKTGIESENLSPDLLPEQWFAIGKKTAKAIRDLKFDPIIPDAAYGGNLAVLLDTYKVRTVLHFTGNLARAELAQACLVYGINYHAIEVYKTHILPPEKFPTEKPDAVLFLSPSAVEGFASTMEGARILEQNRLFAIGKTTQQALSDLQYSSEIPIQANLASLLEFVQKTI